MSGQRVAPTQKISDDASYAPRIAQGSLAPVAPLTVPGVTSPRPVPSSPYPPVGGPVPQSASVRSQPLRVPRSQPVSVPRSQPLSVPRSQPSSTPPPINDAPARARTRFDDPARSLPTPARRPWGLIGVVLLLDAGLAVAGSWMLALGIGGEPSTNAAPRPAAPATPAPRRVDVTPIEPRAAPVANSAAAVPGPVPTVPVDAGPTLAPDGGRGAGAARDPELDAGVAANVAKRPRVAPAASGKGPVDPYESHAPDPLPTETK